VDVWHEGWGAGGAAGAASHVGGVDAVAGDESGHDWVLGLRCGGFERAVDGECECDAVLAGIEECTPSAVVINTSSLVVRAMSVVYAMFARKIV